jgi:hypothetical protein
MGDPQVSQLSKNLTPLTLHWFHELPKTPQVSKIYQ